jgi:hypothetical protein
MFGKPENIRILYTILSGKPEKNMSHGNVGVRNRIILKCLK